MSTTLVDYDDLIPEVIMWAPGCPDQIIKRELQRIGQEFCILTESWKEDLDIIDVTAYETEYTLAPTGDAEIIRIRSVKVEGALQSTTYYELFEDATLRFKQENVPIESTATIAAYSAVATYAVDDEVSYDGRYYKCRVAITVAEVWDRSHWKVIDDGMLINVALRPEFGADEIPLWMSNKWGDRICAGAASRLLRIPRKSWTDLDSAKERYAYYMGGVNMAKRENFTQFKAPYPHVFSSTV